MSDANGHVNGKAARRARLKAVASNAADAMRNTLTPEDQIITIDNPIMKGVYGDVNVFAFNDGLPRIMLITELHPLEKEPNPDGEDRTPRIHLIRWNVNPFIAHSMVVDGISLSRTMELEEVSKEQARMIEAKAKEQQA